jgi:hypothetical protein
MDKETNVPIGASTRQHLVDSQDMVRVHANSQMERVLPGRLGHILVGADSSSLQRLTGKLFVLIGYQMTTKWEFINRSTLTAKIKNANLGI